MIAIPVDARRAGYSRSMGTPPSDDELNERHRGWIEAFVVRARRVEAHSLAQDRELCSKIGSVTWKVTVRSNGETTFTQELPPEEQVESAAARLRPLILNDEDAYGPKALKAIKWFLRGKSTDRIDQFVSEFSALWSRFDSNSEDAQAYMSQRWAVDGSEPITNVSDNVLAFAWLYGDVVHADSERLAAVQPWGVRERFRAAAPLICRLIETTVMTLNFVRWLSAQGLIQLDQDVFSREVVVGDEPFIETGKVMMAPVDTPMPDPGSEDFGAGWQELDVNSVRSLLQSDQAGDDSA